MIKISVNKQAKGLAPASPIYILKPTFFSVVDCEGLLVEERLEKISFQQIPTTKKL